LRELAAISIGVPIESIQNFVLTYEQLTTSRRKLLQVPCTSCGWLWKSSFDVTISLSVSVFVSVYDLQQTCLSVYTSIQFQQEVHRRCSKAKVKRRTVQCYLPPTLSPTPKPAPQPTLIKTPKPAPKPTLIKTPTPAPKPTRIPTLLPTEKPLAAPTKKPSQIPTLLPTHRPTSQPTQSPSQQPTCSCCDQCVIAPPSNTCIISDTSVPIVWSTGIRYSTITARLGDKLAFVFQTGAQNVFLMKDSTSFSSCNFQGASFIGSVPTVHFSLFTTKLFFFASSIPGNCAKGVKITIKVLGT
jgi:hypothetical protein